MSASAVLLVGPLVVTATGKANNALYTIHASEQDMTEVKTTCFSELDRMHRRLAKEVPSFSGRLPANTLKRFTSMTFVENRRQTIEAYLRNVVAHDAARASDAWQTFFAGCAAFQSLAFMSTTCSSLHELQKNDDACGGFENETGVTTPLDKNSVDVDDVLSSKRSNLAAAQEVKQQLGTAFASGEEAAAAAEAEVKVRAALEADAISHLVLHYTSLDDLATALARKKGQRRDRERQQHELAKRFLADLMETAPAATKAASKAQSSYDASRQACIDVAASMHANITSAMAVKVAANAEHAAATESGAAMTVAMTMLQERAKARLDDLQSAERELDNHKLVKEVAAAENSQAEDLHRMTENEATKADAAVVSYTRDAARRNRVHEADVRRARERAFNAGALRDARSRKALVAEDLILFEPAENAANVAADAAAAELAEALQSHEKTQLKDERQFEVLRYVAAQANVGLKQRKAIAEARAARLATREDALLKALAKHAAAFAVHKHIEQKLGSLQHLVDETAAEDLLGCTAKLEEATKELAAAKKTGEEQECILRRAAELDLQVLKKRQAEEAALLEALDSAQIVAVEASDDIIASAWEESRGEDLACKLRSSEAQLVDRDKVAQEAAGAHKEALEELVVARREMPDASLQDSDDDSEYDDDGDGSSGSGSDGGTEDDAEPKEAANSSLDDASRREREEFQFLLVVRIEGLENVLREKQAVFQAATAAVTAAKNELTALRAQQKATPRPTEKLLGEELALVDAGLQTHREKESAIVGDAEQIAATWMKEAELLNADLHRAQLRVALVAKDVDATKRLADSLVVQPSLPTPGGAVLEEVSPGADLWHKLFHANSLALIVA